MLSEMTRNDQERETRGNPGQTHDPLIQSFESGEDWYWCYIDELFLEPAPLQKAQR